MAVLRLAGAALLLASWSGAIVADDLLDDVKPAAKPKATVDSVDDLLDRSDSRIRFRLVRFDQPDQGLDALCYWQSSRAWSPLRWPRSNSAWATPKCLLPSRPPIRAMAPNRRIPPKRW